MAGVDKKGEVIKVKSSSMTPKDIEAEIAATASSISEMETVGGETIAAPVEKKKRTTAKSAKKKPQKAATKKTAKKAVKKGKVMPTSDVRPAKKAPKKPATKAKVKTPEKSSPTAVKVTVKPKSVVSKPKSAKNTETAVLNHRGKDIKPISDTSKLKKAKPPVVKKPKSKPVAVTSKVKLKKPIKKSEKPYAVVKAAKSPVEKPTQADKKAAKPAVPKPATQARHHKDSPHVARIYDTKTYHIPISVDEHHRKAMMPLWAQILTLLAGVAGIVIYVLFIR